MAEKNNGWNVDLGTWTTMKPIKAWQKAALRSDFDAVGEMMSKVIKSWPHASDPANIESYDDLTPSQFNEAARKVSEAVGGIFRSTTENS